VGVWVQCGASGVKPISPLINTNDTDLKFALRDW